VSTLRGAVIFKRRMYRCSYRSTPEMCEGGKEEGGILANHERERQFTVKERDVGFPLGASFSPDTANEKRDATVYCARVNLLGYWLPTSVAMSYQLTQGLKYSEW